MSDLIDRQAAIERINKQREHLHPNLYPQDEIGDAAYRICAEFIERLPSAELGLDEWCTDCKEYDQERHCCPRWNRVIRETLKDVEQERKTERWIPCSERLPERHQKVLITIYGTDVIRMKQGESFEDAFARTRKNVRVSVGCRREERWYGADGYPMIVEPIAWMPMPEPYNEGEEDGRS